MYKYMHKETGCRNAAQNKAGRRAGGQAIRNTRGNDTFTVRSSASQNQRQRVVAAAGVG